MPPQNPNQRAITISAGLLVVSLICTVAGFTVMSGDAGFWTGSLGAIALLMAAIMLPVFLIDGKKKVKEIQALVGGKDLLAHWQYSEEEWDRFTQQEHARNLASLRKTTLWILLISVGMFLVGGLLGGDGLDIATVAIMVGVAVGLTALVGGAMFVGVQLSHKRNLAGVGEVYIGQGSIYFGGQFFRFTGPGLKLTAVTFELGDPAVVEFKYEAGSGENAQAQEVRVPVPKGNETAAQALVESFYEAS